MNWRLIFLLSLFGMAMGYLTVSILDSNMENIVWGIICIFYGFIIARTVNSNYFITGFMVSIVNSVWVTGIHVLLFEEFMKNHLEMAKKMDWFHMLGSHPRIEMILTGPIIGIVFGIVIGGLAWIFSKIMKKAPETRNA